MNTKKRVLSAGLTFAAALLLTACGQSGSDTKTYSSTFSGNPTTFNYLLDYYADNTGYLAPTAAQKDYDLYNGGWSADYLDPSSYLDIFSVKNGGVLQNLGLEPGEANDKAKAVGLDVYTEMLEEANKEQDPAKRYEKYADVQAWLVDSSLAIPNVSLGGTPGLRKTVPFSAPYSLAGNKVVESYKYLKVQDKIVTTDEYAKAREKWLKEKEESNKKAQEELAKHVK